MRLPAELFVKPMDGLGTENVKTATLSVMDELLQCRKQCFCEFFVPKKNVLLIIVLLFLRSHATHVVVTLGVVPNPPLDGFIARTLRFGSRDAQISNGHAA